MSIHFTPAEIAGMRGTADSLMMDKCQVYFRHEDAADQDPLGHYETEPVPGSGDWSDDIICSFDMRPGAKSFGADKTPLIWDATVRLPHDTPVDKHGWVRLVERFNEPCAVIEYMVVGVEQWGPSATRLMLKRVEL